MDVSTTDETVSRVRGSRRAFPLGPAPTVSCFTLGDKLPRASASMRSVTDSTACVRAFLAMSLDGFLAGEGDDLSWLPPPAPDGDDAGFSALLECVGCLLMGRRTYDVVAAMDLAWPYGNRPVLVATHRPLAPRVPQVRAVSGDTVALVEQALQAAAGKDVYVDGGELVRAVLDAGLLDELTVTLVPVILGRGRPLGAGTHARHPLTLVRHRPLRGGMVQLTYTRG
jgi:dihydrofolate reductase